MWLRITLWAMLLGSLVMGYFGFQTGSANTTVIGMGLMIFVGFFLFFLAKISLSAGLIFVKIVVILILIGAFVLLCLRGCQMMVDKGRQGAHALEERSRMITSSLHDPSLMDKVKSYFDFSPKKANVTIPLGEEMTDIAQSSSIAPATFEIKGSVQNVLSGSVFKINGLFIKLYGVAAPTPNQKCLDKRSTEYNCGHAAQQKLQKLLAGKSLTCIPVAQYSPTQMVATCSYNGYDIGAGMVTVGWALADRRVTQAYVPYEKEARLKSIGLWAGKFVAPWEYERTTQGRAVPKSFFERLF